MCRSIVNLRGEQPATPEEVHDAALQYVRKVSGYRVPSKANAQAFDAAVAEVAAATQHLLDRLVSPPGAKAPAMARSREVARAKRAAPSPPVTQIT